jgi:hypothetical protein
MLAVGCGGKAGTMVEVQIAVDAPSAASVLVDGQAVPTSNGVLTHVYGSLAQAMAAAGTVESDNSDGSLRAMAAWSFGSWCATVKVLQREEERFQERPSVSGLVLTLTEVDCVRTDGTGVIVTP